MDGRLASLLGRGSMMALAAAAFAGAATQAQAQETPRRATTVEEVTITAERRVQDLQTAAISATVLDGEAMQAQNVVGLTSLQFAAPGLQISDYASANTFNIRGIGQSQVDIDLPSGVVIYRDGVPTLTGYFQNAPYYDMAGVEVLRGPQGTFVGKSAAAGAVFIRTRDPELGSRITGEVVLGAGNRNAYEETAIVNVPLGEHWAVRLAAHFEQRGSLFDSIRSNPLPGAANYGAAFTGHDNRRLTSARLGVLWQPNDQFRAVLKLDGDYLYFGSHITSGIDPITGVEEDVSNPIANGDNRYRDEGMRASLNMRYTFANQIALNSLTGFSTVNTRANWDSNGSNPAPSGFVSAGTFINYSQEFNLISPSEGRFRWVAGVFFQYYQNHIPDYTGLGFALFTDNSTVPLLSSPWNKYETSYAVFGQVAYDITPQLELQIGGRYGIYRFTQFTQWVLFPGLLDLPFQETPGGVNQTYPNEGSFDWKVNLNYDITPTQFVYGLVSRGHTPGSINIFPGFNPDRHDAYGEMSVINYEAGWKGRFFDGQLRTQLDVYYQTFDGYQAQFGYPVAGIPQINNLVEFRAAETTSRIWGVEFGAQAHFGDLEWNVGMAYNRSRLGNFGVIQNPFFGTLGQTNATVSLNGAETPFAPHWTANGGVQYTIHLDSLHDRATLTPRVDVIYHSESFANLYHNRATLLPAVTLVNASARLEVGDWWAQVWGTNLTDERYPGAKQNVSGSTGQIEGIVYMAPPRLFGIRIGRRF